MSRLDEIKARAEQVHWTSTSIEQATARMASSAADVPWLLSTVECLTDLCDEFRKREESQDRIRERLTAEVERLERWKFEALEVMSGLRELGKALGLGLGVQITGPAALAEVTRLTAERDALAAQVARVEALAEEWRYKGQFGWGPWQIGEGPDPEGYVMDHCASALRAALADPEADTSDTQPTDQKVSDE